MHNPASVFENDKHKLLWYLDIQTDHLISVERPDLIIINKKRTCKIVDLLRNWKTYGTWNWRLYQLWLELLVQSPMIMKGTGGLGDKRTCADHPNNSIAANGQNTGKSPGDFWWLVVTNSSERPSAKTDGKNSQGITIIIIIIIIKQYQQQNQNQHQNPSLKMKYIKSLDT